MGKELNFSFGERLAFILGFIVLIVSLDNKILTNEFQLTLIFFEVVSLSTLTDIFLISSFITLYIYSLNIIRYDFKFLLEIKFLKNLGIIGDISYAITIFFTPH